MSQTITSGTIIEVAKSIDEASGPLSLMRMSSELDAWWRRKGLRVTRRAKRRLHGAASAAVLNRGE